jgi:dolichyl-phosphate beta-glucosyltransferase
MRGFHLYVYIFGVRDIEDTQCGFKLFSREAAKLIFPNMHVEGWIFDIEILILAERIGIPIAEVQVNWHEVDVSPTIDGSLSLARTDDQNPRNDDQIHFQGSKMSLARDSVVMALDLLMIRMNYTLGLWKVPNQGKLP